MCHLEAGESALQSMRCEAVCIIRCVLVLCWEERKANKHIIVGVDVSRDDLKVQGCGDSST